jgi:hypothetical protein
VKQRCDRNAGASRFLCRMGVSQAKDSVAATPLVTLLCELLEESKEYQAKLNRLNAEIGQVKVKIAVLSESDERNAAVA